MTRAKVELFAEETLVDRGQLTRAEEEAFDAMLRYKDAQETLKEIAIDSSRSKANKDSKETFAHYQELYDKNKEHCDKNKELYYKSGFDFDDCIPMGLGWKTNWFGVKTTDIVSLIGTLSPSYIVEQHVCEDEEYFDAKPSEQFFNITQGNYFIVTQACNGTVFLKPNGSRADSLRDACYEGKSNYTKIIKALTYPCASISETVGEVYLFWGPRSYGNAGFILWQNGSLRRAVSTSQWYDYMTYGSELEGEEVYERTDKNGNIEYRGLYQNSIIQMANNWKLNSNRISPLRPGEKAYCWFVDARLVAY